MGPDAGDRGHGVGVAEIGSDTEEEVVATVSGHVYQHLHLIDPSLLVDRSTEDHPHLHRCANNPSRMPFLFCSEVALALVVDCPKYSRLVLPILV